MPSTPDVFEESFCVDFAWVEEATLGILGS